MRKRWRVFVAGLFHETHAYLDRTTGLADFEIRRAEDMAAVRGDSSPLGGVLDFFEKQNFQIEFGADYRAMPGGTVKDEVLEAFWSDLESRWTDPPDAIFLVLHGAMATEEFPDVEGEILMRIRSLPGAGTLPLFGVHDLHANFSSAMAKHANALLAYRENPHRDARESAIRGARLLTGSLQTGEKLTMIHEHAGEIWDPLATGTDDEPMASLEALARELEAAHDSVQAINVNAGFAYADCPDTGVSFQIITTDPNCAKPLLEQLMAKASQTQPTGQPQVLPLAEVLEKIAAEPVTGLTVLVEPSDNIGGGAPGDGTGLLRGLLEAGVSNAGVCINDPSSVDQLASVSEGDCVSLAVGGRGSRFDPGPLTLTVELVSYRSEGRFQLDDPKSHLASMCGNTVDMGPCAVVQHKGITLLLTSRRTPPFDLGQWRSQGLEPGDFDFIGVKAAVAHRRAYDPITTRSFWVDTPGPCRMDNRKRIRLQK